MTATTHVMDAYKAWNARLLDYCREHSVDDQGNVFLTIDGFLEAQDEPDAEARFKQVVRDAFRPPYAHKYEERVQTFCRSDTQQRPLCAALLGICVLAAADMDSNAYYEHLSSWLACPEREVKKAFANPAIEEAWDVLRDYFKRCGLRFPPPPPGTGKRFVKLPQHHALLRQIDLRRLAEFFFEYDLSPRYRRPDSTLQHRFSSWMRNNPLTQCGMAAWSDSTRQNSVFKQVRDALENWDERSYRAWRKQREQEKRWGFTEYGTRSSAVSATDSHRFDRLPTLPVRLFWEQGDDREAYLYLQISHTHANLPTVLPFCNGAFERRRGEIYSVIPIDSRERAAILGEGCEERVAGARLCFQIDQVSKDASSNSLFIFQNTDGSGYSQAYSLQLGVPSALLVPRQYEGRVKEWLSRVCSQVPTLLRLAPFLASDWVLLSGFTPRAAAPAPVGFPALHVSTELSAQLQGGLRLDSSRSVWMESAPPTVCFTGHPLPETAMVEDTRHVVSKGGFLARNAIPSVPGEYQLMALAETSRPLHRSLCIEAAHLSEARNDALLSALFGDFNAPFVECVEEEAEEVPEVPKNTPTPKIALPASESVFQEDRNVYQWYVLGATPGQVCLFAQPMTRAALRLKPVIPFLPVWAIGRGGQGIVLDAWTLKPTLPSSQSQDRQKVGALSWAAERLWVRLIQTTPPSGLSQPHLAVWRKCQVLALSRKNPVPHATRSAR